MLSSHVKRAVGVLVHTFGQQNALRFWTSKFGLIGKISLMLTYTTTVEFVLAKDVRDVCTERDPPEIKLSANSRANRHIHPSRNTRHHEKVYI